MLNNLSYLLAQEGKELDESLRLAQRALQLLPNHPVVLDTLGFVYIKKGMAPAALQILGSLAQQPDATATVLHHLAMAQVLNKDMNAARQSLQRALAAKPTKDEEAKVRALMASLG